MRVEFINNAGGRMLVDESRVAEYKAAGYMLAADVIDSVAVEIVEEMPVKKTRSTRKKKTED